MAEDKVWIWLRLPLVPVIMLGGVVVILLLVGLRILCLPYLLLYPESNKHPYDFGDERQQEAVRRWRRACDRIALRTRLRRLAGLFQRQPRRRQLTNRETAE